MTTLLLLRADATAIPLAGCTVDAICTDPPYSLGFMSRAWDDHGGPLGFQRWCEQWGREALRVLRPGGHLLAFGGTRTYHRLTCGLEDAGFEIRDCIAWMYGSGFPKSLDIGKAIDRMRRDNPDWQRVGAWLRTARVAKGMSTKAVCAAIGAHGAVNHGGAVSNWENGFSCPTWDQWAALRSLLGFGGELDAEVWRLNGRKGQPGEAWFEREVIGKASVPIYPGFAGPTYGRDSSSQDIALTAPATPEAERWQGWGTALKPSFEPIVLARKPLAGSVAATVLAWGTGGLHVDACRVNPGEAVPGGGGGWTGTGRHPGYQRPAHLNGEPTHPHTAGRWPPNTLLSHAEGCEQVGTRRVKGITGGTRGNGHIYGGGNGLTAETGAPVHDYADPDGTETVPAWSCVPGCPVAELDRQSGSSRSSGSAGVPFTNAHEAWVRPSHANYQPTPDTGYRDTGGASRFFPTFRYTAKAGSAERPVGDDGTGHPTVKPLELMRWLVRLVTPPGGIVLDPFCGSGPTLEAALIEGFRSVGLDSDATAVHLTAKRLAKPIPLTFGFDL